VSRALQKPEIMLSPETFAVMVARDIAARAVVDKCPSVKTDTKTREYSRIWDLGMTC
jgi:hypothetical protein